MHRRILPLLALSIFAACEGPAATIPVEESAAEPASATPIGNATVGSIQFSSDAVLVDFENAGTVGSEPSPIIVGGVTTSFAGLIVVEVGSGTYGFGGQAGTNQVREADRSEFSGRFLSGTGPRGTYRADGFVRRFDFDAPVSDVTVSIADIDVGERVVVSALNEAGQVLSSVDYAGVRLDTQVEIVDFRGVEGIRALTIVGNDPVGIDNLRFIPPASLEAPEAATLVTFEEMGPVGALAPEFTASDGTVLTFEGLSVTEGGNQTPFSFTGEAGHGYVIESQRELFSGRFLTQTETTAGWMRRIHLDRPADNVSFYLADVDAGEGIAVRALDGAGTVLLSRDYPRSLRLDARVVLVDLSAASGIRTIEIIGSDPTGIDNLRFTAPRPPTVTLAGPETAQVGEEMTFQETVTPGDGAITGTSWNFGDGTPAAASGTHTFDRPGSYQVTVTVTDARGGQASATTAVRVVFLPPEAATLVDFEAMGPIGAAAGSFVAADGTTLTFEGLSVTVGGNQTPPSFSGVAGYGVVVEAEQEWFDGRYLTQSELQDGWVRRIHFDRPADDVSFFVADIDVRGGLQVRALDGSGALLADRSYPASLQLDSRLALVDLSAAHGIRTIEIIGRDPTGIDNLRFTAPNPPAVVVSGPESTDAGAEVTFEATVTPGDGEVASVTWDFGDGVTSSDGGTHTFGAPGSYEVTVTATDAQGVSGSAKTTIEVLAVPTSLSLSGFPETIVEGDVIDITTNVVEGSTSITSVELIRELGNEETGVFHSPSQFEVGVGETVTAWVAGAAVTWRWTLVVTLEDGEELRVSETATVEPYPIEVFAPERVVVPFGEPISIEVRVVDGSLGNVRVSSRDILSFADGECRQRGLNLGLPRCYVQVLLEPGADGEVERTGTLVMPAGFTVDQLGPGEIRTAELQFYKGSRGVFETRTVVLERPPVDETPPGVTASVNGTESDGWYTGSPTVSWSVTEDESEIVSEQLLRAVGNSPPVQIADSCSPVQINEDTDEDGITLICIATSNAWDAEARAFESSTIEAITIRHDGSAPDVSYLLAGGTASSTSGWWTGDAGPSVDWTVSEPHSGSTLIATCDSGPAVEGEQTFTCTAASAGGTTVAETEAVRYDNSAPLLAPVVTGTEFGQGWYTGEVRIEWDAQDVSPILDVCGSTTIIAETAGETVSCAATSVGGTATSSIEIRTDFTPPTVEPTLVGTEGSDGWFIEPVSVTWSVVETLSAGTESTTCVDATYGDETDGTTVDCSGTSAGGTTVGSVSFRIDRTPPVLTLTGGLATYDVSETISIACEAADPTSGAGICEGYEGSAFTFGAGDHQLAFSATNGAGLTGDATHAFTVTVSADGLADVVSTLVTDANTAQALTEKLDNIASAPNANAARGAVRSFINQVEAKRGKTISDADADLLIALVQAIGGS